MQWNDIDWHGRSVRVLRARVSAELKSTKTHQVRDVLLSDRMMAVLERQKAYSFERWGVLADLPQSRDRPALA